MNSSAITCLAVSASIAITVGCRPAAVTEDSDTDVIVDLMLDPSPPAVGDADVSLTLASASGEPLTGAEVRLEGNMNHAGMKPSFADLEETEPGRYTGTLDFTMGGDWFILVTANTQDGRRIERKIDVLGVQRP